MFRAHPRVEAVWRAHGGYSRAYGANVVYNVGLGLSLILGGPARVSGPTFTNVAALGGPYAWGCAFLLLGVLLAVAARSGVPELRLVFLAGAVLHLMFALQFISTAIFVPHAGLTGIATYLLTSFWLVSQSQAYVELSR